MKRYELFLLFIFLCICLECKYNEKNIRKLDSLDSTSIDDTTEYITEYTTEFYDPNTDTDTGAQANSTETIPKPRIILLGFGNFHQNRVKKTITFNVFFKRMYTKVYLPILYLIIRISNNSRLRNLEEEEKTIKCNLDDKNINNKESNDIKYNCQNITYSDNFTSISVDAKIKFDDETGNFIDVDVPITSNANKDIKNIQNAKADLEKIIILENSKKTQNEVKFIINGDTSEKLNNGPVTLYLEDNGYDGKKNISCILNFLGNNNYELECTPKTSIFARLDNTEGKTFDNQSLLISMLDDKEEVFFDIPTNKYLSKISSNNGLTGGAIAAIVICCVVAIISIVIISILLNMPKYNKSPPAQMSSLEVYGSEANINNKQ